MAASDTIEQALSDPASAAADGQSVSARSMADIIAGLNYSAGLTAMTKRRRGIRYTSMVNPGALDDRCLSLPPFNRCCG